jgi:general secretion pathway protein G
MSLASEIVTIFLTVFIDRMAFYQEYAEKMAMELTAANIRTGLRFRVADLMLANRMAEVPALADENPINWLAEKPENYLGAFDGVPPEPTRGKWYFDLRNRQLVYTVNNRRHFESHGGQDFSVRYRATRQRAEGDQGAAMGETWVAFAPTRDFRWQP